MRRIGKAALFCCAIGVLVPGCGGGGDKATGPVAPAGASVASVIVSVGNGSLPVGGTTQATATLKDAAGTVLSGRVVTWSSTQGSVASVTLAGLVTALANGATTIAASSEGRSASVPLTVEAVATVTMTPAAGLLYRGGFLQLSATLSNAGGTPLTGRALAWRSSDTTVAVVSTSGVVSGRKLGTVRIDALSEGQSASANLTVSLVPVSSVTVTPSAPSVYVGSFVQLTATPRDSAGSPLGGRTISWSSSDTTRAVVYSSGLVNPLTAGTTLITAVSEGKASSTTLTINAVGQKLGSVVLTPPRVVVVDSGGTTSPAFTALDSVGGPVAAPRLIFESRSGSAQVSAAGVVTGRQRGQSLIVATAASNTGAADSTLVVVAARNGPVLLTDLARFQLTAGETGIVVTVALDLRASGLSLGSATLAVTWDPNLLTYTGGDGAGSSVSATLNNSLASSGIYRLAVTSDIGATGRVVLRRLFFNVPPAATSSGKSGLLTVTALDANTSDTFSSFLGQIVSVAHPVAVP